MSLSVVHAALEDLKKSNHQCMLELGVARVCPWLQVQRLLTWRNSAQVCWQSSETSKKVLGEGFDNITQDEVNKFIDAHSEPLMDEDLLALMSASAGKEEEEEESDRSRARREETVTGTSIWPYEDSKGVARKLEEWESYMVRSLQLKNAIKLPSQCFSTPPRKPYMKARHHKRPLNPLLFFTAITFIILHS